MTIRAVGTILANRSDPTNLFSRRPATGPLQEYDAAHGTDMVETLTAFLEHNGAWRTTAAALHIHVSTLHYRVGRIERLTGRDLSTARDRVDLYLACAID